MFNINILKQPCEKQTFSIVKVSNQSECLQTIPNYTVKNRCFDMCWPISIENSPVIVCRLLSIGHVATYYPVQYTTSREQVIMQQRCDSQLIYTWMWYTMQTSSVLSFYLEFKLSLVVVERQFVTFIFVFDSSL